MPKRDRVISKALSPDLDHAKSRAIFERNTWYGGALLLVVVTALTVAAVVAAIPITGLAALIAVFAGGFWFSYRILAAWWAKLRNQPITSDNRL